MIKNRSLKLWSLVVLLFISATKLYAQENVKAQFAPINTAVPSLSIAPDARGGGMGDNGVATLPDVNSQYWNPAKYVFNYSQAGVSLSYTPWLQEMAAYHASGFTQYRPIQGSVYRLSLVCNTMSESGFASGRTGIWF